MEEQQKELIQNIHNTMIDSAKNTCKTKVEPYKTDSAEYNEVAKMLEATFGFITSNVISTILNNPSEYITLGKYIPSLKDKMPLKIARQIDELDRQMTNEGKFGQYPTICATTEVAAREVGNSLKNGCIQTLDNADIHTHSTLSDDSLDMDTYTPRAATA